MEHRKKVSLGISHTINNLGVQHVAAAINNLSAAPRKVIDIKKQKNKTRHWPGFKIKDSARRGGSFIHKLEVCIIILEILVWNCS